MTPALILERFPIQHTSLPGSDTSVGFRTSTPTGEVTHVLLHGIGSGSGSWAYQLQAAQECQQRVLAWDAPGYGASTLLTGESPDATAYALRLWQWLDALDVQGSVNLVGHSLGCIMAARAALLAPHRVRALYLLSPARGYGKADPEVREQKLTNRLSMLHRLGPEGMARERSAAMLSADANEALVQAVRTTMAQVRVDGYIQATHLLNQSDLDSDLQQLNCPLTVASGGVDSITPPASCQAVAQGIGMPWYDIGPVGHACPLEAATAVNTLLGLSN